MLYIVYLGWKGKDVDEIQELYAELERIRNDMRKMEEKLRAYTDAEIRNHVRLEH